MRNVIPEPECMTAGSSIRFSPGCDLVQAVEDVKRPEYGRGAPASVRWMVRPFVPKLVSVIIPTLNRAHMIECALASVAKQTYRPIEIIVVDDGSTDHTAEILNQWKQSFCAENLALHLVRKENGGVGAARNADLRISEGEFIHFLDSDDFIVPEAIGSLVGALLSSPQTLFAWSASLRAAFENDASSKSLSSFIPSRFVPTL